jgi:uncharacterized protein (TIGR00645 family)
MHSLERILETGLFASRWILAPFYVGLVFCLVLLLLHFVISLVQFVPTVPSGDDASVILGVLGLVDIAFTANLVLIVIFSGYENFVSRISIEHHDRPDWMTKVDFSGLKQKLMASIVAISAIQVLKAFMNVEHATDYTKLGWLAGIHLVFVVSMLMLAISDRVSAESSGTPEHLDEQETSAGKKRQ